MKKLLTLLALGVAVKYLLDSEKGKEIKSQIKGWIGNAQDAVAETVGNLEERAGKTAPKMN
jgi:hypothetical protein